MTTPTRLQLGTSRLEYLPDNSLKVFLDKTWVHFGDAPDNPHFFKRFVRRMRIARRNMNIDELYSKTTFKPFFYKLGDKLPFSTGTLNFIFSEHFFEHFFLMKLSIL